MAATKSIRFKRGWRIYNTGNVHGLPVAVADELIAKGIATLHVKAPATALVNGVEIPTPEQVIAAGYPAEAVEGIIARQQSLADEAAKTSEPLPVPERKLTRAEKKALAKQRGQEREPSTE